MNILLTALMVTVTVPASRPAMDPEAFAERAWQEAAVQVANEPDEKRKKELAEDEELGKKYSLEAEKEYKLSTNAEMMKRVEKIGQDLAAIANVTPVNVTWGDKQLNRFTYNFKVIEGEDVNAFSLPGGYIYIFEGLLKYAESDAEVAGVLAHEISHAAQRHVVYLRRKTSKFDILTIPLILATILTGRGELLQLGNLTTTALSNGWTVDAEKSADYAAFQYMNRATYNPTGLLTFMERLARDERSTAAVDWGIYRTHPPGRQRAEAVTSYMEAAGVPIRRSLVTTTYRTTVEPGEGDVVQVKFGKKPLVAFAGDAALDRADSAVDKLNQFFDENPQLFEVAITADGTVVGRRRPLFQVTPEDAEHAKVSFDEFRKSTLKSIKEAMYGLAFKTWNRQ